MSRLSQDILGPVFKPGADMESLGFRRTRFEAFATVPMKGFHKGMGQFPYDMEELIRIIKNEPEGYTCSGFTIPEDVKTNLKLSLAASSPQSSQS
jgi:hypothetical protein